MGAALLMAPEKKSPEGGVRKKRRPVKPLDASVKVAADFKEMLEEVADDLGLYPGELLEKRMSAFVSVESLRIRKQKYEQAKKATGENRA